MQKQLRRRFQRFMAERGDYNNLLLTILRNMVRCWHAGHYVILLVFQSKGTIAETACVELCLLITILRNMVRSGVSLALDVRALTPAGVMHTSRRSSTYI